MILAKSQTCPDKQKIVDERVQYAGNLLGIPEITDCDSGVSYVMKEFEMNKLEICDSNIAKLLDIVPGDQGGKDKIVKLMIDKGIDLNTRKLKEACICTCS